jgi:hypothetical protein
MRTSSLQTAKQAKVKIRRDVNIFTGVVGMCKTRSMKRVIRTSKITLNAPERPNLNVKLNSSFFGNRTRLKANPGTKNRKISPKKTLKNCTTANIILPP